MLSYYLYNYVPEAEVYFTCFVFKSYLALKLSSDDEEEE